MENKMKIKKLPTIELSRINDTQKKREKTQENKRS